MLRTMKMPSTPPMSFNFIIRTFITFTCFVNILHTASATNPPINDKCSNATNVTSVLLDLLPFSDRVNTRYATTDLGNGTCSVMSSDIGVWYSVVGNNQKIAVDVTTLNKMSLLPSGIEVALFSGTCDKLICLKSITDQTENPEVNLSWNATIGQQYYIIVAGTSASTGTFIVNFEVCTKGIRQFLKYDFSHLTRIPYFIISIDTDSGANISTYSSTANISSNNTNLRSSHGTTSVTTSENAHSNSTSSAGAESNKVTSQDSDDSKTDQYTRHE